MYVGPFFRIFMRQEVYLKAESFRAVQPARTAPFSSTSIQEANVNTGTAGVPACWMPLKHLRKDWHVCLSKSSVYDSASRRGRLRSQH